MNKIVVAAVVAALVGGAAFAALHVKDSICKGMCPLTGEAMRDRSAPVAPPDSQGVVAAPAPVSSAPAAHAAPSAGVSGSRCSSKRECMPVSKECAPEAVCDPADCPPGECTPEQRAACAKKGCEKECDAPAKAETPASKP